MNCPSCGYENIEGNDRCENCLAPFRDLDVPRVDSAEGLARSVMEDNLGKLDYDETISVSSDTPALEVARLMKNANCGCALVVDGGKLVGIFTEHDVLLQMSGQTPGRPGKLQFVEPLITGHSVGTPSVDTPNEATALIEEMQLNAMPSGEMPVEEMRADAADVAETQETSGNDTRSTFTFIKAGPVKHLMTAKPEVLDETASVAEALNKMSMGRYRHIPFKKSDGTYSVASIQSVLKYIAREDW